MSGSVSKVIVVNDFAFVNGGAARIALLSLSGLRARNKEVVLFAAVDRSSPKPDARGCSSVILGQQDILSDPNRLRAFRQGLWNRAAARKLSLVLEQSDPSRTVVHVHGWHKALSSSVVRASLDRGFKTVLTLHDYFAACPNGGFYNYPGQHVCTLRGMSLSCLTANCDVRNYGHKLYRVARQLVQQKLGRLPGGLSHFIYYSETALAQLKPYLPQSCALYRVDNPIPMEQAPPAAVSENSCFVFLGRLAREKGIGLFAEAVTAAGVEGVVIGSGPEEEALRRAFPSLRWEGWQPPDTVRTMLREARCLVFPSVWYETQGLVVREAAALGVPAIVSDVTAAREWIAPGRNGLLFASGSRDSLTEKIIQLRDNDPLAASLGKEAYRRYWDRPTTTADHAEALLGVYEKMLASPR